MKPAARVDWERLSRFADQHQTVSLLALATTALVGVERILQRLPTPDPELRDLLLRATLRAAMLRQQALGAVGDGVQAAGEAPP